MRRGYLRDIFDIITRGMNIFDFNGEHGNVAFATASAIVGAVAHFYAHLAPWLLLGLVLVLVDLRYGIMASRIRGETIRASRACRRTVNKSIDYLCWVTVAEVMSRTFGVNLGAPVVSMAILFLIYGIEINSCVNNYLEYKGIRMKKFDFFRLIGRRTELAIEDESEQETDNEKRYEEDNNID